MGIIHRLDETVIRQIAAGEVVESPASVIKELIENSLDAEATEIGIDISTGGQTLIRVADNGYGMSSEDLLLATERHTTSKILTAGDLEHIITLGFRGEFLSSVTAVAEVHIISCLRGTTQAWELTIGPLLGVIHPSLTFKDLKTASRITGTTIEVRNLFAQVPARKKFLKLPRTDTAKILELVQKFRLARPNIRLSLSEDNKILFQSQVTNDDSLNALIQVLGKETVRNILPLRQDTTLDLSHNWKISGWISKPTEVRPSRGDQYFVLNGRIIEAKVLREALEEAYGTYLARRQYPVAVIYLEGPVNDIDPNVHPAKIEVRFKDEPFIHEFVYRAIKFTLESVEIPNALPMHSQPTSISAKTQDTSQSSTSLLSTDEFVQAKLTLEPASRSSTPNFSFHKSESPLISKNSMLQSMSEAQPLLLPDTSVYTDPFLNYYDYSSSKTKGGALHFEHVIEKSMFLSLEPLIQLKDTYILARHVKDVESFFLIDQHALAERLALEDLLALSSKKLLDDSDLKEQEEQPVQNGKTDHSSSFFKKHSILRQSLLVPITITLTPSQMIIFNDTKDLLVRFGFRVEEFGPGTVLIRAVPIFFGKNWLIQHEQGRNIFSQDFRSLLDNLEKNKAHTTNSPQEVELAKLIACRNSIKAGDKLSFEEMTGLLERASRAIFPFVCCHGRPSIFKIDGKEIDKIFWR